VGVGVIEEKRPVNNSINGVIQGFILAAFSPWAEYYKNIKRGKEKESLVWRIQTQILSLESNSQAQIF